MSLLPPLSLYIHIPWCVQKCPYCDFNSHTLKQRLPEQEYIQHLLTDLSQTLTAYPHLSQRSLHSIFIGGGTPSLLTGQAMDQLIEGVAQQFNFNTNIEITMEANPGAVERRYFSEYRAAGINRISLGIQSFHDHHLKSLGRIHHRDEALKAIDMVQRLGFPEINLDIMHGLPNQTLAEAMQDLTIAIALQPTHLSWYQLTIEPNTLFASRPPTLPDDDLLWSIYDEGQQILKEAGYQQYEVSAYAKEAHYCQHNLNYWRFGDYIGIGCGAHGKLSDTNNQIIRTVKTRHPKGYLEGHYLASSKEVTLSERAFEFFLNRFRLFEAIPKRSFTLATGLPESTVKMQITEAIQKGYLTQTETHWQTTAQGKLFLNSLLEIFLESPERIL